MRAILLSLAALFGLFGCTVTPGQLAAPPAPESAVVVPVSTDAVLVAGKLATELGARALPFDPRYGTCVATQEGSARMSASCLASLAQDEVEDRIIAVSRAEGSNFAAYSVRREDGAALRFASTSGQGGQEAAAKRLAATLNGSFSMADLFGTLPLIVLVLGGLALLLIDAFGRHGGRKEFSAYFTSLVGLATFYLAYSAWGADGFPYTRELFGGSFSADRFSLFVAMLVGGCVALTAPIALGFFRAQAVERGEFYALVVLSASGMLAMAQSTDLFVTFVALEVMSLAIYVLVGFMRHERRGAEGAMKYFLLGAFSSAFLLYGIALVYGAVGTTKIDDLARAVSENASLLSNPLMLIGVFLILGGFLFKIAAIPFHMWTPDAYQAAPSPVTGFMAFGVKLAAFTAMLRTFGIAFWEFKGAGFSEWLAPVAEGASAASLGWYALLFVVAAVTMLLGNLFAVGQTNVKRLLAYSSIAHAGYLLVGVITMAVEQPRGQESVPLLDAGSSVLFYLMVYGFTTLLSFGALSALERRGEDLTEFENLRGVARRHPGVALAMSIALLSLAGIPPTGGFFAKMLLFREAIRAGNADLIYLSIFGVLASVIAVYYYLRVVVVMYMEDPAQLDTAEPAPRPGFTSYALFAAAALVLYFGLFPNRYVELSKVAIREMAQLPAEPSAAPRADLLP